MMKQMEDLVIKVNGATSQDDIEDGDNYNEESRLLVRPTQTHSMVEAQQCNNAFNNSN